MSTSVKTINVKFSGCVWIGAVVFAAGLLVLVYLLLGGGRGQAAITPTQPVELVVLPAPSATPIHSLSTLPTVTPTVLPGQAEGEIKVGVYVQIAGTDGDGLRLREAPGLTGKQLFLGNEAEVFEVKDGPKELDGFTWWYLAAPYDATRRGWAVGKYLIFIPKGQ